MMFSVVKSRIFACEVSRCQWRAEDRVVACKKRETAGLDYGAGLVSDLVDLSQRNETSDMNRVPQKRPGRRGNR